MLCSPGMPGILYKKWLAVMLAFMALFLTACGEKQEERSKLIMVTNATFPPYEFYQGDRIVGVDADMVREIARRNNYELVIEDMSFDSVIAAVQTGKGDVAASGIRPLYGWKIQRGSAA